MRNRSNRFAGGRLFTVNNLPQVKCNLYHPYSRWCGKACRCLREIQTYRDQRSRCVNLFSIWYVYYEFLSGFNYCLRNPNLLHIYRRIGYRLCPRCSSSGKTCTCGSRHRPRGAREVFRYARARLSLDEHRGQGRYPAYTPNSNIDSECMRNWVADQM